jgi:hypothetical protein
VFCLHGNLQIDASKRRVMSETVGYLFILIDFDRL